MYQCGIKGQTRYKKGKTVPIQHRGIDKRCLKLYFALMAKQAGDIFITGSIDDLCFYKMDGKYYVRMKSSLTSKRFWKHKAFEGSRKSCSRFAEGNQLASKVYRMIEEEKRVYSLFCFLKKKAIQLLKEEKSLKEAEEVLIDYLVEFGFREKAKKKVFHKKQLFYDKEWKRACRCREGSQSTEDVMLFQRGKKITELIKTPVTISP